MHLSKLQRQFAKYRPPALPVQNQNQYGQNPYANNPPPPQDYHGQSSFQGANPYGANPPPPAQTYQPSVASAYGGGGFGVNRDDTGTTMNKTGQNGQGNGVTEHEHGYEWAQAREQERLERERAGAEAPPPGYDVTSSKSLRPSFPSLLQALADGTDLTGYAPPAGPPPGKRTTEGTV
jgi:hypothetical protein